MTAAGSLADEAALVTGASSGIGRVTAEALATEGAHVAVAARREGRLRTLVSDIEAAGVDSLAVPTDVTDPGAVDSMVERTIEEFGGLDIVVNNAGIARGGSVAETSLEDYRATMATNVDGTFFTTKATLPHLRASSGTLVLMGSYAGTVGYPRNPVYGATRWWIRGFARSVAADAGADGVGVTLLNPSEVRTRVWEDEYEEGEILAPETVAETIVFASQQSPPAGVNRIDLYRRDKLEEQ
jgi:NADP-dependent 3-hydroxy acid dehydrogenase YdfG